MVVMTTILVPPPPWPVLLDLEVTSSAVVGGSVVVSVRADVSEVVVEVTLLVVERWVFVVNEKVDDKDATGWVTTLLV